MGERVVKVIVKKILYSEDASWCNFSFNKVGVHATNVPDVKRSQMSAVSVTLMSAFLLVCVCVCV